MGYKSSPEEIELYKRVDEVLHYLWDSIGIAGEPRVRDEYYSYLPKVYALVLEAKDNEDVGDIVDYLQDIAHNWMALTTKREKAEEIARILMKWKDKIFTE